MNMGQTRVAKIGRKICFYCYICFAKTFNNFELLAAAGTIVITQIAPW
jgi:hypothetical protein